MKSPELFPELPRQEPTPDTATTQPVQARLVQPVRDQVQWMTRTLDSLIPRDHQVRSIWAVVTRLDLRAFYADIRSVLARPGRPASDPQVLLALWVYANVDGVSSARRLARLCAEHDAYRWLCGRVPVDYHLLADFRVAHRAALDEVLTQIIAVLLEAEAVTLIRVAQDGVRVRASAGASSFHRKESLEQHLAEARAQVAALARERERSDPHRSRREQAAVERAARERQDRLERALQEHEHVQVSKDQQAKKAGKARDRITEARASTTDPEARVMKMANGGYNPAYNAQLATDVDSQVIVGVSVTQHGTDHGEARPVCEQVIERTGQQPGAYLIDGGYVALDDIAALEERGIMVLAPPKQTLAQHLASRPHKPEPAAITTWRARMETEGAQAVYRDRAATAECVNAQARNRYGLQQFRVRGLDKVTSVMLLIAITHDLLRWLALGVAV